MLMLMLMLMWSSLCRPHPLVVSFPCASSQPQLIAYELAILRGINPDVPRNLAKAVTTD
jgi:glucosamine 6-phosphate synthetase-like amidotransferase/phosphosugar isomerase protein